VERAWPGRGEGGRIDVGRSVFWMGSPVCSFADKESAGGVRRGCGGVAHEAMFMWGGGGGGLLGGGFRRVMAAFVTAGYAHWAWRREWGRARRGVVRP